MKIIKSVFALIILYVFYIMNFTSSAIAAIPKDQYFLKSEVGNINSANAITYWLINVVKYLGWAGVLVGVFYTIALLIYKIIVADDQEVSQKIKGGFTKVLIILLLGILLLSGSFIIGQVSNLTGADLKTDLNQIGN